MNHKRLYFNFILVIQIILVITNVFLYLSPIYGASKIYSYPETPKYIQCKLIFASNIPMDSSQEDTPLMEFLKSEIPKLKTQISQLNNEWEHYEHTGQMHKQEEILLKRQKLETHLKYLQKLLKRKMDQLKQNDKK